MQANKIKEKCDEIFNEKKKNLQKKKFTDIEKNVVVAGEGIENNIKSIKKEEINKLDLDSTEKINNEESNKIKNFNNPLFSNIFGNNDFIINNNLFQNYSLNPYQNYPLSNFGNNMVFYNNMQTSFMNDFIFKQLHYTHLRQMMRGIGNIKKEI